MRHLTSTVLVGVLLAPTIASAVGARKAAYMGGTVAELNRSPGPVEGRIETAAAHLVFTADKKPLKGQRLEVEYRSIVHLEYGQRVGRRVAAAMGATVLLGPIGLLSLPAQKRQHFLTVSYLDAHGKDQIAVLELGKDIVRPTLAIIEARSGTPIDYQDDDARRLSR